MNLLVDDTRPTGDLETNTSAGNYKIAINQYRIGFNVRCRYDVLDPVLSSAIDEFAPFGIKQGIVVFGDYIIIFVAGMAYYRLNTNTGYTQIANFSMSTTATRYWTVAVPVSTTNYGRLAISSQPAVSGTTPPADSAAGINAINISSAFQGNLPGLLVQDGINQPQFIFLDINNNNAVTCRTTQTYSQWDFVCDGAIFESDGTTYNPDYGNVTVDDREYVPIGTYMAWYNGILFIVAPDTENIYRSVSGRPLDFVVNVDINGQKGGDASTTSYSVGVGGIACIANLSAGLFVSAGNACFSVTLNTTQNAPTIFGEYTFIRTFLFTAACISDRAIMDINGDTAFVDVNGLRSFNSILQAENEGRNSVFSKTVSSLFAGLNVNGSNFNIAQDANNVASVSYDNYALFAVNTIYGNIIVVYDTISQVYSSLDISQFDTTTGIKQFAAIATEIIALYAITEDDKVIQLYCGGTSGNSNDTVTVRFMSVCSQDPKTYVKQSDFRCILSQFIQDSTASLTTFVDNRLAGDVQSKTITYVPPLPVYNQIPYFSDANTQVQPLYFSTPNCTEGWKVFNVLSWTGGGHITNVKTMTVDNTPINPLSAQANVT